MDDESSVNGGEAKIDSSPTPYEKMTQGQRPKWLKYAAGLGVVLIVCFGFLAFRHSQSSIVTETHSEPSDAAEQAQRPVVRDFTVTDAGGQKKQLSDFKGNVVVLSFWASWCGPCLMELPTFAEMERKYHDRGLRVVPVNLDEGDDGLKFAPEFWKKKNLPFANYFDASKAVAQQFEVDTLPSNFVIDRAGRIAFSGFGANDWSSPETMSFIESVLSEK